jgi:ribosomal protein S18 acetylase RimI-like enzyme
MPETSHAYEVQTGDYTISDEVSRLDLAKVYGWISGGSYWAAGIPYPVFIKSLNHSLCFGLYGTDQSQIGFARVTSDHATYGYLQDVWIDQDHRGKGLGKILMTALFAHPELQGFRRWTLATRDAHGLYQQFGFTALADPTRFMERLDPEVYRLIQADKER